MCKHGYEDWEKYCTACWKEKAEDYQVDILRLQAEIRELRDQVQDNYHDPNRRKVNKELSTPVSDSISSSSIEDQCEAHKVS